MAPIKNHWKHLIVLTVVIGGVPWLAWQRWIPWRLAVSYFHLDSVSGVYLTLFLIAALQCMLIYHNIPRFYESWATQLKLKSPGQWSKWGLRFGLFAAIAPALSVTFEGLDQLMQNAIPPEGSKYNELVEIVYVSVSMPLQFITSSLVGMNFIPGIQMLPGFLLGFQDIRARLTSAPNLDGASPIISEPIILPSEMPLSLKRLLLVFGAATAGFSFLFLYVVPFIGEQFSSFLLKGGPLPLMATAGILFLIYSGSLYAWVVRSDRALTPDNDPVFKTRPSRMFLAVMAVNLPPYLATILASRSQSYRDMGALVLLLYLGIFVGSSVLSGSAFFLYLKGENEPLKAKQLLRAVFLSIPIGLFIAWLGVGLIAGLG